MDWEVPRAMTLATGRRQRGFTLVELMIVISIMMVLFALVIGLVSIAKSKSSIASTKALVEKLSTATTTFQATVGSFPPDGIDSEVVTAGGTRMQSGAALTLALTTPRPKFKRLADGELQRIGEAEPVLEIRAVDLGQAVGDDPQAREFLDAWREAIHYDNVQGGYSPQSDGSYHLVASEKHGGDPRESEFVMTKGAQNTGRFDIWSHGEGGHSEKELPANALTSWQHFGDEGAAARANAGKQGSDAEGDK